jgi:hypothetical protein
LVRQHVWLIVVTEKFGNPNAGNGERDAEGGEAKDSQHDGKGSLHGPTS